MLLAALLSATPAAMAQNSALETNTPAIRLVSGSGATGVGFPTHEFIVNRAGQYQYILRATYDGRIGIGANTTSSRSFFSVNAGPMPSSIYTFSADELGSQRLNNGNPIVGIPGAGACIGFNANRQIDAAIGCESDGSRNGGALIWGDVEGGLSFAALPNNHGMIGSPTTMQWYFPNDVATYRVLKIKASTAGQNHSGGQVQIGPMAPLSTGTGVHKDYRLAVDGKLVAKSIFVTQASANWADFVFEPGYRLLPLPELADYLAQHRHLPAIPSAAEVAETGIDLGTMQARLLQSLEELTLHVIALDKQNQQLQAEIPALRTQVQQAEAR